MHEECSFQVRCQEAVLDVDRRCQREFGHFAGDEGLVGRLLGITGHQHDPARVQRRIDVVMAAVDVECMFGQGAGGHFQDHRGQFSRGVVILFDSIHDPLAGSEVDNSLAGCRISDGSTLSGMLPFCFDGDLGAAEDV